jgi:hypothetical protein
LGVSDGQGLALRSPRVQAVDRSRPRNIRATGVLAARAMVKALPRRPARAGWWRGSGMTVWTAGMVRASGDGQKMKLACCRVRGEIPWLRTVKQGRNVADVTCRTVKDF